MAPIVCHLISFHFTRDHSDAVFVVILRACAVKVPYRVDCGCGGKRGLVSVRCALCKSGVGVITG
jgi:hypothetical protein